MRASKVFNSAAAGFIATAPMTAVMFLLFKFLPRGEQYDLPPEQVTQNVSGRSGVPLRGKAKDIASWIAHFLIGGVYGAFYMPLSGLQRFPVAAKGSAFGLFIWTANYLGILPAARILPPATKHPVRRSILMIVAHLVWGVVLAILTDTMNRREDTGPSRRSLEQWEQRSRSHIMQFWRRAA